LADLMQPILNLICTPRLLLALVRVMVPQTALAAD
jgi:hypothetical protein